MNTGSEPNYISGDILAQSMNIRKNFNISNAGSISSDLPFNIDQESDRWIRFTNTSGSGDIQLDSFSGNLIFMKDGDTDTQTLISVDDQPMIIKAVDCLPKADKYVFVCKSDHIKKYNLDDILSKAYPNVEIITVDETTKGQACTAELGILNSSINEEEKRN